VRVDDEPAHSDVDQMIERKSDERFLKNRHEGFGQIVCQRPQARAASCSENESLRDTIHREKSAVVVEETVWRGTSSQWKNFGVYVLCALTCWLIVPIFIAVARYLQTKCKIYELTTERLKITQGVFNKVTSTLELYRVKDIETHQPFFARLVGVENVQMNTSDASTPFVFIDAVPSSVGLADKLRNQVEIIRQQKRVREIDIE
jgi:uncharacterized membrane protein YdbT with pleckstrin-like domain